MRIAKKLQEALQKTMKPVELHKCKPVLHRNSELNLCKSHLSKQITGQIYHLSELTKPEIYTKYY